MTYLLACALCAGAPVAGVADLGGPSLRISEREAAPLERIVLAVEQPGAAPLALSEESGDEGHSRHGGGAHVGPMVIVMGVVMVGMMVALGAYMMRGHWATSLGHGGAVSPQLAAIPPENGFRPGG